MKRNRKTQEEKDIEKDVKGFAPSIRIKTPADYLDNEVNIRLGKLTAQYDRD